MVSPAERSTLTKTLKTVNPTVSSSMPLEAKGVRFINTDQLAYATLTRLNLTPIWVSAPMYYSHLSNQDSNGSSGSQKNLKSSSSISVIFVSLEVREVRFTCTAYTS